MFKLCFRLPLDSRKTISDSTMCARINYVQLFGDSEMETDLLVSDVFALAACSHTPIQCIFASPAFLLFLLSDNSSNENYVLARRLPACYRVDMWYIPVDRDVAERWRTRNLQWQHSIISHNPNHIRARGNHNRNKRNLKKQEASIS